MKNSTTLNKILYPIFALVFWTLVWWLVSALVGYEYILPSPFVTAKRWVELAQTKIFWSSTLSTLLRVLIGFVSGAALGVLLGVFSHKVKLLEVLMAPAIKIIKVTPVASCIIVLFVWIESEWLPIAVSAMMVLPIIWQVVFDGLKGISKNLLEMGRVFGFSKWQIWTKIIFRSVLPSLLSALITALGFAWKSGVATEVISAPSVSIGRYLLRAKTGLETADVFAWTLNVILLSLLLEGLLKGFVVRKFGKEKSDGRI